MVRSVRFALLTEEEIFLGEEKAGGCNVPKFSEVQEASKT